MPAQGILPQPLRAAVLLGLELVFVADGTRANAQVLHAGHEVEANFCGGVARDAALEDGDDFGGEGGGGAGAVGYWGGLETVEFVERVVY